MTELERALVALGRELDVPAAPSLAPLVRARVERRTRTRRALVLAFATAIAAIAVAMAVPQARTAILRFFHIGSVTIERVETLPPAQKRPPTAGLGQPLVRKDAEQAAGFSIILPRHRVPAHYYALSGLIAATLRADGKLVLLVELQGDQLGVAKKLVGGRTSVEPVQVGRNFGFFISGGSHVIAYVGPNGYTEVRPRLAGNVLVWTANGRTFRLEGDLSRAEALRLAREIPR